MSEDAKKCAFLNHISMPQLFWIINDNACLCKTLASDYRNLCSFCPLIIFIIVGRRNKHGCTTSPFALLQFKRSLTYAYCFLVSSLFHLSIIMSN